MKNLIALFCAAGLAAVAAAAEAPALEAGGTDWASRLRVSAGGFGRFGAEAKLKGLGSDNGDLWGAGLDVQFNLIPAERFNLWVGLGGTYIPEQDFADFAYSEGDAYYSYTEAYKMRIRSYGMRLMAVPEWKVCDAFALGLRLGVSLEHYKGEVNSNWRYSDSYGTASGYDTFSDSDNLVQGIVGLQATWNITDHFGLFAYVDGRFGGDVDLKVEGEKIGAFDGTSCEAGLGLHWVF